MNAGYGFFSQDAGQAEQRVSKITKCGACGLYKSCRNPKSKAAGRGEKGILLITAMPEEQEDMRRTPFVGPVWDTIGAEFKKYGIELARDCRKISAVNCRPQQGRTPNDIQIDACRAKVWDEITQFKPKLIFLFADTESDDGVGPGASTIISFLGHRWKKNLDGITKWRGWVIPDRDVNAWVAPVYHPTFFDDRSNSDVAQLLWRNDLSDAFDKLKEPLPPVIDENQVGDILSCNQAVKYLDDLVKNRTVTHFSFDYETTGLKPHREGHKIVSCSVCTSPTDAVAFPVNNAVKNAFRPVLAHPKIGKLAHGMKFEDSWSRARIGTPVRNWSWCSMNAAHVLDNRPGICGLKFQTYVNFGVVDYDSRISHFLESEDNECGNGFNRIFDADLNDVLAYNKLDAIYGLKLAVKQVEALGYGTLYDLCLPQV
jgi:uracil-DNA glycosylase family 4